MWASYFGNAARNSETGPLVSSLGTSPSRATSASSTVMPISRARMTTLRATSVPDKSSRGSGSVYPSSRACVTNDENDRLPSKLLKRYESVPERIPSISTISSPVCTRSRNVWMIGSAAPTVVSYR